MTIETLVRPNIRALSAYRTAENLNGALRLHANEVPTETGPNTLNRYPEARPTELHSRLAEHFGVSATNLLATRGSSEAIDLLIRSFCRSGVDNIVIAPPTFSMYQIYADIQGAETICCPLLRENGFAMDVDSVIQSCTPSSKLIFVCSPNNPTGNAVPRSEILRILDARMGKSIVVVDEAYVEFADNESMAGFVAEHDNLAVLRTLSKALALAGARCGALIGSSNLIRLLDGALAPYALATPVIDCVMQTLTDKRVTGDARIEMIIAERERVAGRLGSSPLVRKVWPSQANFLLVKFANLAEIQERLQAQHILIREFSDEPGLDSCARITIGNRDENERLLAALTKAEDLRDVG